MKTEKNIFVAFFLNLFFSIFELIGGLFSHSYAILSDSVHDLGDSLSIGLSYILEKKSKHKPDCNYTFGYVRYSVLGAFITTTILIVGSLLVIFGAVKRLFNPVEINYKGMFYIALFGVVINTLAAFFTREGDSLNQKAVNLHMLEDVLGWIVVLIGSIVIRFTDFVYLDSILSILVALFVLYHAFSSFKKILDLFLEKVPKDLSLDEVKEKLLKVSKVEDVHHIHLWQTDEANIYLTMHIVSDTKDTFKLKKEVRDVLSKMGISHVTMEIEGTKEECLEPYCDIKECQKHHHH